MADGSARKMPPQKPGLSEQNVQTPPEFLAAVTRRFGKLRWDLASSGDNVCPLWIGEQQNSLVQDWHKLSPGGWLYCNPPYADLWPWAEKAGKEAEKGARILLLTPAAPETVWYRELLRTGFVLELAPRIKFVGHKQGFPKGLALTVYELRTRGARVLAVGQVNDSTKPTCPHASAIATKRWAHWSGENTPWLQCPDCGFSRALKKSDYPNLESLPEFDLGLQDRLYQQAQAKWETERDQRIAERDAERTAAHEEWLDQHNEYLKSPEWAERRRKVLRRAAGICEACLERGARQVHHTTYAHWRNEPLWELRAVCNECHDEITRMDREKRSA